MASTPRLSSSAPGDPPPPRVQREARREENRRLHREQTAARQAAMAPDPWPLADAAAPDFDSDDADAELHKLSRRALFHVITSPASTNQDRIAAYSVTRLAAGVGKAPTPQRVYRLPMESLLPPLHATEPDGTSGARSGGGRDPG